MRRVLLLGHLLLQRLGQQVQARQLRHRIDPLLLLQPLQPGPGSERPQNRTRRQLLPLVLGPQLPQL